MMNGLFWVGLIRGGTGIVLRMATWRTFLDRYAKLHSSVPPRSWLWTRDSDPDVERSRLIMVAGSILAVVGIVLMFAAN